MASTSTNLSRESFPDTMSFRKPWRVYQARLLDHLNEYLEDERIHFVAAPGSGKTVLGLEVIRRINKPTLILAPTITIRDQWVDRLVDLFLPAGGGRPDWVSTDLRHPEFLTVATYQALHAFIAGEPEKAAPEVDEINDSENHAPDDVNAAPDGNAHKRVPAELPDALTQAKFRTVLVDEAHHLRTEWWKTLTAVVEHLDQPTIVALTATPPYDVSHFEWQRYENFAVPWTRPCQSPN